MKLWHNGKWVLTLLGVVGALTLLYFYAPQDHPFYPRCLLYATTGIECPGCGGLRAMHALLHGEVATAYRYNPLLMIFFPLLAVWGLYHLALRMAGRPRPDFWGNPTCIWVLLGVIIVFSVARNLPIGPLAHLHP